MSGFNTARSGRTEMDDFIDDAVWMVANLFKERSGIKLDQEDMEKLNDLLTEFFTDLC